MDFELTEEHKQVKKLVSDFSKKEILPSIKELDEKGEFDRTLLPKMSKAGLLGICIPKKYGGFGFDYLSLGLACWELEKADTSARVILSVHVALNSLTILQWGNEAQKKKYLIPHAKGEKIGAFGLTEPNAGTDVSNMETTAVREGDNYILNGEKTWISLADVADDFIVFAYTDKVKKHKGISAFIVEKTMKGVETRPIKGKLGVRAGDTGRISLDGVRVPKENLLGLDGEGFSIAMSALDSGRYTVASGACGIIEAALGLSVKHAKEREAFGKKIGEFELIQQKLARMRRALEVGRLLVYYVGWLKNQGIRNTKETSLAKWTNCEAAFEAASDCLEIYGAYGYSNEYPVERLFRNARGAVIYEGTHEIHEVLQAEYALGLRSDKPLRCEMPGYEEEKEKNSS